MKADRRDIACREITPPDKRRRQGLADFASPKPQQSKAGAMPKGIGQPCHHLFIYARRVLGVLEQEASVRCEAQLATRHGG